MAPTWIIGGALLQKRKAIGLVSGLGLLFQVSMLFIGLIALVALRPFVSDQQFPVTASGRRANSTASKLRQHKPLSIASRTIAIVPNDDISAPRSCPPIGQSSSFRNFLLDCWLESSNRAWILGQYRIKGQQRNPLYCCLRHQETVERILVNRRQAVKGDDVITDDRKFGVAIVEQPAAQESRVGLKISPTETPLYGNLPRTGGTEEQLVLSIIDQFPGVR